MMLARRISRWFFLITILAFAIVASPARADFDSAVGAYDQGAYSEAYSEFSTLARAGDERAQTYLNRIRRKLQAGAKTGGTSSGGSSVQSPSGNSGWGEGPSVEWSGDVTPWNPSSWYDWVAFHAKRLLVDRRPAAPAGTEIVVPYHASVWATIFYLPADAVLVGLQYIARWLDADELYRDFQIISEHRNTITGGILAVVWWLLILRALYAGGAFLLPLIRVAFASFGKERYG